MIYTTYYAQTNSITEERYKELKEAYLSTNTGNFESFHLRKLEYQGAGQRKAVASYYLCMKNRDEKQIFLEKMCEAFQRGEREASERRSGVDEEPQERASG